MSFVDELSTNVIKEIAPIMNDKIKHLITENINYKIKYENLLKEYESILSIPIVKKTIDKLNLEIYNLKKNNENIKLIISEKEKEKTNCKSDTIKYVVNENKTSDPFSVILDQDYTDEELKNLTPFYRQLWLQQQEIKKNKTEDKQNNISDCNCEEWPNSYNDQEKYKDHTEEDEEEEEEEEEE